jgi:hypothetical protein
VGRLIDFMKSHLEYNQQTAATSADVRNFAKWILEVIRNLVVVGFITLLAQKSDSWMLTILAAIAGIALFSYVEPIRPRFVSYKTKWVSVPLFLLFALLVLARLYRFPSL